MYTQAVFSCTPQLATPKVQQLWSLFDCCVNFGRHSCRFAPLACCFVYGEGYVAAILLFSHAAVHATKTAWLSMACNQTRHQSYLDL